MIDPSTFSRLQAIGLSPALVGHAAAGLADAPGASLMRVIEVHRDSLVLHDGDAPHAARALPALLQQLAAAADGLAVGDWVLATCDAHGQWWAHARLPPLTQIARRLHDGRDKATRTVIVANVDTALLVMGLDHDFNPRRLERYLALVRLAGVAAVAVLTKADLCGDAAARVQQVQQLVPADVAVRAVNALGSEPAAALAPWLGAGQTLVLLGSSGVGKSTLVNALLGVAVQDTGGNRKGDQRGRHTTTARSLHPLPGGACLIDTPGLRTLRLDSEAGSIQGVFDDIAAHAMHCRFRDCRHDGEPGCAVREAVPGERIQSFQKLLREAKRDTLSALQRKEQVSVWKARSRAARAKAQGKRGSA